MLKSQVIILGGGVAGISCARALQKANIDYLLIEKSGKLGGRLKSEQDSGYVFDHGFQVFLSCYDSTKGLISNDLALRSFASGAIINLNGINHKIADPLREPRLLLSTLHSPIGSYLDKALMLKLKSVGFLTCRDYASYLDSLPLIIERLINKFPTFLVKRSSDRLTTLEYLKGMGFSDKIIDSFFRPFLGGIFLDPTLSTSADIFLQVFGNFSRGKAQLPDGGMEKLAASLAEPLDRSKIILNQEVVNFTSDKVVLKTGDLLQARAVVSALDADSLRSIKPYLRLPDSKSVSCFYFSSDPIPELDKYLILNGSIPHDQNRFNSLSTFDKATSENKLINNIAPLSNVNPSYAPAGKLNLSVSVLGEYSDEIAVSSELHRMLPGHKFDFLKKYVVKGALPDQRDTFQSGIYSNLDECDLIVCGDFLSSGLSGKDPHVPHCQTPRSQKPQCQKPQFQKPLAASIETAVRSGLNAASKIIKDFE